MKRAVFLDRDGVVNRAFIRDGVLTPPRTVEEVEILFGVRESVVLLTQHNFEIVIVTNQPDVARGLVTRKSVTQINEFLELHLGIMYFYICFHDDSEECDCRKPKPGLIQKAAVDLDIDLTRSFMVGDRWRDIAAGQSAGCDCFFIDYQYTEKSPLFPYTRVSSLLEATQIILGS